MSDTQTATPTAETSGETTPRKFDVEYTLDILDGDLPPAGHGGGNGGGNRTSPLELKLDELKGREDAHGKWVLIGKYGKATAAGAAANVLRIRHGRNANAEGFEFAYRKIDQDGSHVNGLFVRYDPEKIVPGAKEAHEEAEVKRVAELAAARKIKAEADGTSNGSAEKAGVAEKVAAAQKAAAAKK